MSECKSTLPTPQTLADAQRVDKLWGGEIWLTNNDRYCAKVLVLAKGAQGSLHYHPVKDETMIVIQGIVGMEICDAGACEATLGYELKPGSYIRLEPGTPHRFQALSASAVIVEVSTPHSDDDVVRIEDSRVHNYDSNGQYILDLQLSEDSN